MKTVCIVQARMGSARLPGKVLLPLNGHTVLQEVLDRCKRIQGVDDVVCATPDAAIVSECKKIGARWYLCLAPEGDVLTRYYQAAVVNDADIVMRITGDCPLISPELCGEVLKRLKDSGADYASNIEPRTFPKGLDCEAFTMRALEKAHAYSREGDREHVTPWMRYDQTFKRVNVASPWKLDGRLTLDTEDDYRVICAAFGHEPYQGRKAA